MTDWPIPAAASKRRRQTRLKKTKRDGERPSAPGWGPIDLVAIERPIDAIGWMREWAQAQAFGIKGGGINGGGSRENQWDQ